MLFVVSCGSDDESSSSDSATISWSLSELNEAKSNCIVSAMNSNESITNSQASFYCGCVFEEAAKRWEFEDFILNESTYTQELNDDGTMRDCAQKSKSYQ